MPTFVALKELGGSGNNDEILHRVIANLNLPDEVVDIPHIGASNISELQYQLAWSRTYLKLYGAIENSVRSVWSIHPNFVGINKLGEKNVLKIVAQMKVDKHKKQAETGNEKPGDDAPPNNDVEYPFGGG